MWDRMSLSVHLWKKEEGSSLLSEGRCHSSPCVTVC